MRSHIGMMDDRHAVAALLPDGAALHARARMLERVLIGALRDPDAFDADAEPRVVHHREHVFEAAILLADEIADRTSCVSP